MNKYRIRKNKSAFTNFCEGLKRKCTEEHNKSLTRRIRIIELHGQLRLQQATPTAGRAEFEKLFEEYTNTGDHSAALECLFELGQFLHRCKDNIAAIEVLFFAEKFAAKFQLTTDISYQGILHTIGYILWELEKPAQSIRYFKKSIATGNGILQDSLVALNGLGINYQKIDSLNQSLYYFNLASRLATAHKNEIFNAVVLGSAAVTLFKLGQDDTAYLYCLQYKKLSLRDSLWQNAADAFHQLVLIELKRNNPAHARLLLDSFQQLMPRLAATDYMSHKKMNEASWRYFEKLKIYNLALSSYKNYVHYDSLFQEYGNKNKISELELDAAVRMYEQDMAAREKKKKFREFMNTLVILALFITVVILVIIGYKKIKQYEYHKQETANINEQQAAEIRELKEKLLAQLASIKNDNLNYQAQLASQHVSGDSFDENNNPEKNELPDTISPALNENAPAEDIRLLKEFNLTQKQQWKEFRILYEKIYPDFEKRITEKTGSVSAAELRLMMLHKLGLSNKEIAQTLLISPDSVKKAKYRLYKKIGINSAEELNLFLE
ncbi:MAG: LuxR C-terminal-related transcriptional regulator [Bacteroidetes bacterium]|nr:LuxR C-terminal-related transcriptional regulator [Bacteroidota bacterium]